MHEIQRIITAGAKMGI